MRIKNDGADYSGTGLGKLPYVSTPVGTLLSIYPGLSTDNKEYFQAFIDDIGGLSGSIWTKTKHVFLPVFSSTLLVAMKDLKSSADPFVDMPDARKPLNYTLTDGRLTQLYNPGNIDNRFVFNTQWYKASVFGSIKRDTTLLYNNHISQVGHGAIFKAGNGNSFTAVKYDGISQFQQRAVPGNPTKIEHTFSVSGLQGVDVTTQNVLVVDGTIGLIPINAAVNLAGSTTLGRLGYATNTDAENVRLRDAYILGYGVGYTREETIQIETAINSLMTSLLY